MTTVDQVHPIVAQVRAKRAAAIPPEWRLAEGENAPGPLEVVPFIESKLTFREREITGWTAFEAVKYLVSGEVSSVEVTKAICHRAALAHQLTNCLTEIFFDVALTRAAELDEYFKTTGKTKGPLHGLPVSIKEEHGMKGTLTTWGFVQWAKDGPAENDSAVVTRLLDSGAVLYAKTNVPQALMTWESANAVWGHVLNPNNTAAGAGGSSGGEGALIAAGGSFLGVGTDIAGSVRLPCSINGIVSVLGNEPFIVLKSFNLDTLLARPQYGLKPSARRFPYNGSRVLIEGTPDAIVPTHGPMGRSVDDLDLYCKVFADPMGAEMDPNMIPLGWRDVTIPTKLKIGYFTDAGFVRPTPPVERAVLETVAALKAAGHEMVQFQPPDTEEAFYVVFDTFASYNDHFFETIGPAQGGEGLHPSMAYAKTYPSPDTGMGALWKRVIVREVLKAKYLGQMNALGIDFFVCPTVALPSCLHNGSSDTVAAILYTFLFNFIDLPAGVIPVTHTHLSDTKPAEFVARNEWEKKVWDHYDSEKLEKVPVGVQIVGRRYNDEKLVACMKVVDAALKFSIMMTVDQVDPIVAQVRAKRAAAIPPEWRLAEGENAPGPLQVIPFIESKLTDREREITGWTASEAVKVVLLMYISSGEVTSVEVTKAICHRAALAHQLTNCLTEIFFDIALARAAELDEFFKTTGKTKGPFHGLPVSIKEEHGMKGTLTTWGLVQWAKDGPAENDSAVVQRLLDSGAVLYAKTNVPQALMTWESANAVWGHVLNPNNTAAGAGGSSGGEGALIAAGGSFLGVGTDIGGSIRLPSSINGI
ncbi:hypothetical protein HDU93_008960, partial [Gonapodya sp. JEL0774]